MELQARFSNVQARGLGLAAISYDGPEILADFSRRRGITFPLLSDKGSAVIRQFGLLNTAAAEAVGPNKDDPAVAADVHTYVAAAGIPADPSRMGMAFPGTLVLDRSGRVTSRFFENLYFERNTLSSIMQRIGGGTESVAATKVSTAHLDVVMYPSDTAISAGNRFVLAFQVQPRRGIHVYAPGASSYRVVAVTLAPQPFLRASAVTYPASEIYYFKPLNERVPVYLRPFTLLQEVLMEGTREAQAAMKGREAVTVSGTLDYQACDDKVCYNPVSVPFSWTLALRPLDFERPTTPR